MNKKVCQNKKCRKTETPLWRNGWVENGVKVKLCNACGLHYNKGNYCKICKEIYDANFDLDIIELLTCCNGCNKYFHTKCLQEKNLNTKNFVCSDCEQNK